MFFLLFFRDPGLGAFLIPGSGIRDGRKFFDEDPGWRQFGSGIRNGKSRIRDPG
jgi:hypothetical protein